MTTKTDFKNHVNKCKKVAEKFGTTKKFECTGFVMPDGRQINFCHGKYDYDHHEVSKAYLTKRKYSLSDQLDEMEDFMRDCRAVRFRRNRENVVRIHAITKPTEKQAIKLAKGVEGAERLYAFKETERKHHVSSSAAS